MDFGQFRLEYWHLAFLFVPILLNLWSIWHAFTRQFASTTEKQIWIMIATMVPVIGGLVYIFFGVRRSRKPDAPE